MLYTLPPRMVLCPRIFKISMQQGSYEEDFERVCTGSFHKGTYTGRVRSPSGLHSTLIYFTFYNLHTLRFTLHTPQSTLYALHFKLYAGHPTRYTFHSTLYTVHSTLYTLHSTLCTLHSTLYTLHFTLHTLHSLSFLS